MNDFINNINLMHKNWIPSQTWETELRQNEQKDKVLQNKYPPTNLDKNKAKQYGKTVIRVIDKLDQQSIDKSTDAMIAISTLFSLPSLLSPIIGGIGGYLFSQSNKALKNQKKLSAFNGVMIGSGLYFIVHEFINAQLEKITTRIARFQARNKELNHISNFIIYNNKQQEEIDKKGLISTRLTNNTATKLNVGKTYKNAFSTLNEMKKDYQQYQKWKNDFKLNEKQNKEKLKTQIFSDDELSKAQIDRNRIINTIYKLELAANNEEINFQYAIDLVMYAAKMSGAVLATLLCCLIPKSSNIVNKSQTKNSFKLAIPLVIPIFSMITGAILMQYQKDSAKLGRYEKKKELLSNENSFITFDNNKRAEVNLQENAPQKNTSTIKSVISDIKSIKTMPERLKIMYADKGGLNIDDNLMSKLNISEEQKQEAELLQKQLFYSFEKIDEKSEGFSDDIDVVLRAIKTGLGTAINIGFNIFSLNLLTKRLKNYNNNKMPGFIEGLKLMKHLNKKDIIGIFVLPYIIKSTICVLLDTMSAHYRKKANKVGVMTAIKELEDERIYTKEYLQNII